MRDLRERRFQPLPMRLNADHEHQRAVGHQLCGAALVARNEGAAAADPFSAPMPGLLGIAGKAHPDQPAIALAGLLAPAHRAKIDGLRA